MDNETKHWLIVFEDNDRSDILITEKDAAIKAYENFLLNWNCHLFEQIYNNGKEI